MTLFVFDAESGTVGELVTSSDVPGFAVVGSGGTLTYSSDKPRRGTKSLRVQSASGTNRALYVTGVSTRAFSVVEDICLDALPSNTMHVAQIRNEGVSPAQKAILAVTTAGRIQVQDAASATVATSPVDFVVPAGSYVKYELTCEPGSTTSNGRIKARVTLVNGAVWSYDSGPTVNAGVEPVTHARLIRPNTTGEFTGFADDIAYDDASAAFIGQVATTVPPAPPTVRTSGDQTRDAGSAAFDVEGFATPQAGSTITQHRWEYVSGPQPTLGATNAARLRVTPPASTGTTVLRYTPTDSNGRSASATLSLTWLAKGQVLVPVSTVTVGGWVPSVAGAALHTMINETVRDDSTYISSPDNPVKGRDFTEVALATGTRPSSTTGVLCAVPMRVRPGTSQHSVDVQVRQGTTIRATRTYTDLTTAFEERDVTLTAQEAAAVDHGQPIIIRIDPGAS